MPTAILLLTPGGRSPPRGGFSTNDANQQYLLDDPEPPPSTSYVDVDSSAAAGHAPPGSDMSWLSGMSDKDRRRLEKALKKAQKRQRQEQELKAAEDLLLNAGYDVNTIKDAKTGVDDRHRKRHKSSSHKK